MIGLTLYANAVGRAVDIFLIFFVLPALIVGGLVKLVS